MHLKIIYNSWNYLVFVKKLLLFQIRIFKSKINNLEDYQMYFKNICLHFAYLSNELKNKIIFEKKLFQKCYFF